ncbi:hypothetical protein BVRB_5g121580 [Beta vulgaris subsp. vulgaris]|nr:hypothetical protein BVRB_5g121580 [Beta vulgaris subsp. vulgaris]
MRYLCEHCNPTTRRESCAIASSTSSFLGEYSKDLLTYLRYCKDAIFAGSEPLYKDATLIEELWQFYKRTLQNRGSLKLEQVRKGRGTMTDD